MALQNIDANITLDLYNHDTTPSTVKAIQLDSQTRYVAAMLQNMGAQYDVDSGAAVQLIVIRPDKVGVQITGTTFTYGDEGAQFLGPYAELTQVALAVNGKMRGQFKITSGDQILRTEIFAISNGEALDASTDEWADEYDGYNLEEMATSIETNTADIATLEADVSQIKEGLTSVSSRFEPLEPIIVNMYDYFWANGRTALSTRISTDADAKNLYLVVSGNEGASVVTVDSGSPLAFANLSTTPMAGIIEYSDGVDLISLYVSNGTLTVYPPLKETITGVKIYSLAVGIHLTAAGYKYYADCLYNTDRRYTRKNKAIAQYNAYIDYNPATSGITKIGSYWWGKGVRNIANESFRVIMNGCNEYLNCSLVTGATTSAPKGLEWEQNLAGKNGYFEMYIGGKDATAMSAEFESGYEFHFEWYLDGILADSYIKKTKRLEAVRFNFNNAQTGKIKFYVTAGQSGYEAWITQMTWWETDETNGKIFSDYKVPCLLMDSWGVYHDNAFQTRLVELLTENNGLPSYVINKSLGSTTSEWGLNNFYSRAWIEHPDYIISDFQINDVNTSVTQETFVANMKKLIDASIGTGIVPVLIMQGYNTTSGTYSPYTFPFLAALANLT